MGNVLSAVLRQAWDHGELRTLVSGRHKAPVTATNAHVSVIAHITVEELRRLLTETDAANGFGNRFLWVCVKRSKLLPSGGMYPEHALHPLTDRLTTALFHARTVAQMQRTPEAETRWEAIYTELAGEQPGLLGAITARAEAQVLRLSCLYALLAKTDTVDVPHLDAANALWRYCEASARYIFGTLLGDPLADDIYRMLQQMAPDGMARTDIHNALGRHHKGAAIGVALDRLRREGMARCTVEKTSGRPIEWWFARLRISEESELSPPSPWEDPLTSLNSQIRIAVSSPPVPACTDLTASALWCGTCKGSVTCRKLIQLDGTEVYLCNACDTEVGRKHTTAPPSSNGTQAPDDAPHTGPPLSGDEEDKFGDIPF
jgi:hypothetical protein